jgi:hypothetical protein
MAEMYKGQRITELLEMIDKLQGVLADGRESLELGEADVVSMVESEATLAIMKAKLTALQGEK